MAPAGELTGVRPRKHRKVVSDTDTGADTGGDTDTDVMPPAPPGSSSSHSKGEGRLGKLIRRLVFGSLLLVMLCFVIGSGHLPTLGFVLLVQVMMFRELVNVRYSQRKFKDLPLFRTTQWGWFAGSLLYSYGSSFSEEKRTSVISSSIILSILPYVPLISLAVYSTMLIVTVASLKKGHYRHQIGQLAWTIAIIVITVAQVNSFTDNIFNGLFWFLFPVALVICNDSMAYFCGLSMGKKFTQRQFLGALSPNKTWEGFIGGGLCTILFAFGFARVLCWDFFQFLICPCETLEGSLFQLRCSPPEVFVLSQYSMPWPLDALSGSDTVSLYPVQLHALALATFASFVAPFGGFFASGIKRAYKIDDFASIIPGHGGVFDRVDCQLIMGLATSIYYTTFIGRALRVSLPRLLKLAASLGDDEKVLFYNQLKAQLKAQRLIR